jgi:hypothetical protein
MSTGVDQAYSVIASHKNDIATGGFNDACAAVDAVLGPKKICSW